MDQNSRSLCNLLHAQPNSGASSRVPRPGNRTPQPCICVERGTPRMLRSTAASATVCASPRTFLQAVLGGHRLRPGNGGVSPRIFQNRSQLLSRPAERCRRIGRHICAFPLPWRQLVRRHEQRLYVGGDVSQAPQCGGQFRTEHAEFIQHFLCACIVSGGFESQ